MPAYRLLAVFVSCTLAAALLACASSKKGTAVVIVHNLGAVRGCDFLGRLVPTTAEGSISQGTLRQRVVEIGGDTLLLLPAGSAEAWNCRAARIRVYVDPTTRPTPTPPFRPTTPRPTPGFPA